jgi:hypothetical protein
MVQGRNACLWDQNQNRETPGWGCKPVAIVWALAILLFAGLIATLGDKGAMLTASPTVAIWVVSLVIFWRYCQDCDGWKGLWIAHLAAAAATFVLLWFTIFHSMRKLKAKEEADAQKEKEKK